MKTGLLYGIVPDSVQKVRCVFCGIYIFKNTNSVENHAKSTTHKENIDLMWDHGLSFNDLDEVYCKLCESPLDVEVSTSQHIQEEAHANWKGTLENLVDGELMDLEGYLESDKDVKHIYCEACDCNVNCVPDVVEEHVNNIDHRGHVMIKLKPLNGIFPVDNEFEVWCKICNCYIENSVQEIIEHIDTDDQHVNWFSDMETIIDNNIVINNYLANEFETNAHCNKCNIDIPCNLQSLEDHIVTVNHLNNLG